MFLELLEVAQPFSTNWITIFASTISEKVVNFNSQCSIIPYKDIANLNFEHLTCQGRKID